jgi:hypothetical protein
MPLGRRGHGTARKAAPGQPFLAGRRSPERPPAAQRPNAEHIAGTPTPAPDRPAWIGRSARRSRTGPGAGATHGTNPLFSVPDGTGGGWPSRRPMTCIAHRSGSSGHPGSAPVDDQSRVSAAHKGGQGRGRTADLPIFSVERQCRRVTWSTGRCRRRPASDAGCRLIPRSRATTVGTSLRGEWGVPVVARRSSLGDQGHV